MDDPVDPMRGSGISGAEAVQAEARRLGGFTSCTRGDGFDFVPVESIDLIESANNCTLLRVLKFPST